MGIAALSTLIAGTILFQGYQEKSRADFMLAVSEIRISFQHSILDSNSWAQSEANDVMMSCFTGATPSSCLALNGMAPRDFKIYSGSQLLYDSSSATDGYTAKGEKCTTYGTDPCILKPHITWVAQCNLGVDPTCTAPLVIVSLSYQMSNSSFKPVDLASYGFQVSKATFGIQAASSCSGAIPACSVSQAAICEDDTWTCEEFGL